MEWSKVILLDLVMKIEKAISIDGSSGRLPAVARTEVESRPAQSKLVYLDATWVHCVRGRRLALLRN